MTTNDQASFLNGRDQARVWRVFCSMRYAGGLNIARMSMPRSMTTDDLVEALEQLSARLDLAAEAAQANEAKLREHDTMFKALGKLAALVGLTREEAASVTQGGTGQ